MFTQTSCKTAGISNPASEIRVQYGTHTPAMVQFPYIKLNLPIKATPHSRSGRAGKKTGPSCAHKLGPAEWLFAKMSTILPEENNQETKCIV